ncbi:hypothetical protein ABZ543_08305 [Streptomyces roseifaciens]
MGEAVEQEPRIPGVRYEKTRRYRQETTVVDGQAETENVPYDVWVPAPPRDWDQIVLRAVTGVAIGVTVLAVAGTAAGVGGLLSILVTGWIAYSVALVFDASWLCCIAVEWLERFDPPRARGAQIAGWVCLAISMTMTIAFGKHYHQLAAGIAAASVSLLAKGLWWLVLRHYAVPLSPGIRFWLRRRRERIAATMAVSGEVRRLKAQDAYVRAAFGPDAVSVEAITAAGTAAPPAGQLSGPAPDTIAPAPAPAPAPVPPAAPRVPAPVPPAPPRAPRGPAPQVPARAPKVPAPPAPAPQAPAPAPEQELEPGPEAETDPEAGGQGAADEEEVPQVRDMAAPSMTGTMTGTIREALRDDPEIGDTDLIALVRAVHGDRRNLDDNVLRLARRVDPTRSNRRVASKQKKLS